MLDNSQGRLVTTKSLEKLLAAIGGKFRTDESAFEAFKTTNTAAIATAQAKADAALPKAEFEAFKIELEGMFVTEAEVKQMMVDAGLINELPAVPSMP